MAVFLAGGFAAGFTEALAAGRGTGFPTDFPTDFPAGFTTSLEGADFFAEAAADRAGDRLPGVWAVDALGGTGLATVSLWEVTKFFNAATFLTTGFLETGFFDGFGLGAACPVLWRGAEGPRTLSDFDDILFFVFAPLPFVTLIPRWSVFFGSFDH